MLTSFAAGVIGRQCKPFRWCPGAAPWAFQYVSHMNSQERHKMILKKCQLSMITGRFFVKNKIE